jgi:hypothetical protein
MKNRQRQKAAAGFLGISVSGSFGLTEACIAERFELR